VRALRVPLAVLAVSAMVVGTALLMGWPLERAVYLAPVIVVGFTAAAGLLILWGKVAWQQLRETKRPRLVISLWILGIGLLVLLTVLGVKLPKEG
jgi:uncharacterized membrane protein YidH (DUF202 family)